MFWFFNWHIYKENISNFFVALKVVGALLKTQTDSVYEVVGLIPMAESMLLRFLTIYPWLNSFSLY